MILEREFDRVLARGNHQIIALPHAWLKLFVQNADGRPALVLESRESVLDFIDGGEGFSVDVEKKDTVTYIRISSSNKSVRPAFVALCRYMLSAADGADSYKSAVECFLKAIDDFRRLMARPRGRLVDDEIRGLFAELALIRMQLDSGTNIVDVLRSWSGPFGNGKDFILPVGGCFEVKSAHRPAIKVRISSIEQLDPFGESLRLVVVPLERTGEGELEGLGFLQLIGDVQQLAMAQPESRDLWESAIDALGLDVEDDYYRRWYFVVGEILCFEVTDEFPRLERGSVPADISEASYSLQLAGLQRFRTPLQL